MVRFFAGEIWCVAVVSSVSPSSEQTEVWCVALALRLFARNYANDTHKL